MELGLKIFLVASECVPFIKTGGIGGCCGRTACRAEKARGGGFRSDSENTA